MLHIGESKVLQIMFCNRYFYCVANLYKRWSLWEYFKASL